MIKIIFKGYEFTWDANEDFTELVNFGPIPIQNTTAEKIEEMNLTIRSKILLSAVAGAVIQYMIDCHPDEDWRIGCNILIFDTERDLTVGKEENYE